jgi:hypothetical protein
MRSRSHLFVAVSLIAALAACSKDPAIVTTPYEPSATLARVRILNTTNTTLEYSSPDAEWAGINKNIRFGVSRCIELAPNTAPLVRDSATQTALTGLPTTFEAGKTYSLIIYSTTAAPAAPTYAFTSLEQNAYVPPSADSGGIRFAHLGAGQALVDVYMNIPNAAAVPPLTAANRIAQNVPFASVTNFFPVKGNVNYQVRITRNGITNATLVDQSYQAVMGESSTVVLGMGTVAAPTTLRQSTAGGC